MHNFVSKKGKVKNKRVRDNEYHLNTMFVGCIGPTRRRQSDERVREVYKYINKMPMPNSIDVVSVAPLNPFVLLVPIFHVMAHKQSWSIPDSIT